MERFLGGIIARMMGYENDMLMFWIGVPMYLCSWARMLV
jgi:hypothetical protein